VQPPDIANPLGDDVAGLCPVCWQDGYESKPIPISRSLIDIICDDPPPRRPKRLIWWDDNEWQTANKIEAARAAHQASTVLLDTDLPGHKQIGFDFMRSDFKVKGQTQS
jgi:hypothetical protein